MWLRDALPYDITHNSADTPIARVMTYGYESRVSQSKSIQNLEDLASSFHTALIALARAPTTKPIILIAHSLGGLIVKQALISLSKSKSEDDRKLAQAVYGIVFFGVPHEGMDTSSLIPMVGDGPNRFLIESISRINSQILGIQQQEFHTALGSEGDSEVFCFYETLESPTAHQDELGNWTMTGATAVLVTKSSATHCRPWERGPEHICAIARTHSDMVKFRPQDHEYDNARETIKGLVQRALSGRRRFQTSETKLVVRNNGGPKRQLSFGNGQESYGVAPNQMDISSWQNHGESSSSRPRKRHRAFPNDFVNMIHEPQNASSTTISSSRSSQQPSTGRTWRAYYLNLPVPSHRPVWPC